MYRLQTHTHTKVLLLFPLFSESMGISSTPQKDDLRVEERWPGNGKWRGERDGKDESWKEEGHWKKRLGKGRGEGRRLLDYPFHRRP